MGNPEAPRRTAMRPVPARACRAARVYDPVRQRTLGKRPRLCPAGLTGRQHAAIWARQDGGQTARQQWLFAMARSCPDYILFHLEGDSSRLILLPPDEPMKLLEDAP